MVGGAGVDVKLTVEYRRPFAVEDMPRKLLDGSDSDTLGKGVQHFCCAPEPHGGECWGAGDWFPAGCRAEPLPGDVRRRRAEPTDNDEDYLTASVR